MLAKKFISKYIVVLIISIFCVPSLAKSLSEWKQGVTKTINNNIKHCRNNQKNSSNRAAILNTKISRAKKLYAKSNIDEFSKAISTYTNAQNVFVEAIDYFKKCQLSYQSALEDGLSLVKPTKNTSLQVDYFKSLAEEATQLSNQGSTSFNSGSDYNRIAILHFNTGIKTYNNSIKNENDQVTKGKKNNKKTLDNKKLAIHKHMDNSLDLKNDSQKMVDSIAKKLKASSISDDLANCLSQSSNFHKKAIEEINQSISAYAKAITDLNDPESTSTKNGISFYNAALDYLQKANSITDLCSK